MSKKVLLAGDVRGRLSALFARVAAVNKSSGPFDLLLCVGRFFSDPGLLLTNGTLYIAVEKVEGVPLWSST